MRAFCILAASLLLAACTGGASRPAGGTDDFAATDIAPDAVPARETPQPKAPKAETPLSSSEEADAALLLIELERAADETARGNTIKKIVALGPRYLPFLRGIDHEPIVMDLVYIISRIEREHGLAADNPTETVADNGGSNSNNGSAANGGEGGPKPIDYGVTPDNYNRDEVERFLADRLNQAQSQLEAGRHEVARRIAEAALTLLPDTRYRPEFEAVLVKSKGDSQSQLLIAGTLSLEPDYLRYAAKQKEADFAEALQIRCFLKNVSTGAITLRLYEGEGKESLVQLAVRYEQLDYQDTVMSMLGTVRLPVSAGESITLQPGDSYELTVPLVGLASLDADAPLKQALGRVEIEAALRVYGAYNADGSTLVLKPITFPKRTVLVFPADYDLNTAQQKPLTAMHKAIEAGKAQEVFMAAFLMDDRNRRAAGDLLTADDFAACAVSLQRARLKAMTVLFETGATWDIKRWRQWWTENRLRN